MLREDRPSALRRLASWFSAAAQACFRWGAQHVDYHVGLTARTCFRCCHSLHVVVVAGATCRVRRLLNMRGGNAPVNAARAGEGASSRSVGAPTLLAMEHGAPGRDVLTACLWPPFSAWEAALKHSCSADLTHQPARGLARYEIITLYSVPPSAQSPDISCRRRARARSTRCGITAGHMPARTPWSGLRVRGTGNRPCRARRIEHQDHLNKCLLHALRGTHMWALQRRPGHPPKPAVGTCSNDYLDVPADVVSRRDNQGQWPTYGNGNGGRRSGSCRGRRGARGVCVP